ncbi:MAG: GNAT family N-acetyltransferase, partial [Ignavibacteria bacterium]|nr:GNAT family N-acetyltransferase [Ignavibacteria bacterium]
MTRDTWQIRDAQPTDAVGLAGLAETTFRESYRELEVDEYCTGAFGPEIQLSELSDDSYKTIVVESAGVMIGYAQLVVSQAPPCVEGRDAIELRRIYVGKRWHGTGVAQDLMTAV